MALVEIAQPAHWRGPPKQPASGGEPPYDGGMEARIARLEDFAADTRDRLARIETRMDTFATKEDLHKEIGAQTWRIVGALLTFGTLLSAAVFFIAKNVH